MTIHAFANRPTWIEVSRAALIDNVRCIRRQIGPRPRLAAVIKANGYGHGAVNVAKALASEVNYFAVATLSEALELRTAAIDLPILVLGYTPAEHLAEAVAHDVTVTIFDSDAAVALNNVAAARGQKAKAHVKINTGMNRLGLLPDEAPGFLTMLRTLAHIDVEGIFTHFATSDTDLDFAAIQFARFRRLLDNLEQNELRPPIAHAANSAAMLKMPETHLDMVRSGIALYGLHPDAEDCCLPEGFRPAMQWKAVVAQVMELQPGDAVSYGREFVANCPMTVAAIPVGYADGFPRRPHTWGSVLVHGRPASILGRVCMDQTIVDVTPIVAAGIRVRQGDEVVLIGRQGNAEITVDEVGRRLGTINYDVVSRILARVPRVLVDE